MSNEKFDSKLGLILQKKNDLRFNLQTRDGRLEYFKFKTILNYCLNCLSYEYREIIEQSYLNCDYRFWWVDK